MARPAVIPASQQGRTVVSAVRDTTRPEPNPSKRSYQDASTQSPPPECGNTTVMQNKPEQPVNPTPCTSNESQSSTVKATEGNSRPPSPETDETTTYIARTDSDLIPALQLISDSVAQQRQLAARYFILHPIVWAPMLLSIPYLLVGRAHDSSDWLVIVITMACIMIFIMTVVKIVVNGYLEAAERVGRWSWLYGDRWIQNRFRKTRQAEQSLGWNALSTKVDYVFSTRFGEEVIAAIVIRIVDTWDPDPDKDERSRSTEFGSTYLRKKICIRAWTVKQRYRRQGVGLALLRFVIRWALDSDLEYVVFADDHAHSLRVLPTFLNKKMDKQDARARDTLYWEMKHYSTSWHQEQREEKNMVFPVADAKPVDTKENDSAPNRYWGLSPQKGFNATRGRLKAKSTVSEILGDSLERITTVRPSRLRWADPNAEYDFDDSDRGAAHPDAESGQTKLGWGSSSPYAETPSKKASDLQTMNDQYMRDIWEGCKSDPKTDSPESWERPTKRCVDPFNQTDHRNSWGQHDKARAQRGKAWGNRSTSCHNRDNSSGNRASSWGSLSGQRAESLVPTEMITRSDEWEREVTWVPWTPTITSSGSNYTPKRSTHDQANRWWEPSAPTPQPRAEQPREEIFRRSFNKAPDRPRHFSCESCGCTVTTNDRINMADVSPPGVWFDRESRFCASCGLRRIRQSIDQLERSARGDDELEACW